MMINNEAEKRAQMLAELDDGIYQLVNLAHDASLGRGWWMDPVTQLSLIPNENQVVATNEDENVFFLETVIRQWFPFVIAAKIALIHSEVSEALEAYRVDAMDDKLPEFAGITVEMADVLIRVGDLMGCLQRYNKIMAKSADDNAEQRVAAHMAYSLPAAVVKKMSINITREDHSPEARKAPGGKKF